jgi:branched-chain amino acid transport system ATP-binding protein
LTGVVPAAGYLDVMDKPVPLGTPGRSRRAGVLRTYQAPQTYDHLSCIEDVLISTEDRQHTGVFAAWFLRLLMLRSERARWNAAIDALTRVGLEHLAARPTVMLLDEPSAGLDASETATLAGHLMQLRDEGVSILVIDHKLDFITNLCDRVAVLELGHLVAVGDAATVFEDQRVVDAYLGVSEGE